MTIIVEFSGIRILSNIYLIFDLSTFYGYKEGNISNNSSEEPNLINYILRKNKFNKNNNIKIFKKNFYYKSSINIKYININTLNNIF